ncbi:hypothetical protein Y032_0180g820 [Ancylostoma ceylanicum]|uniref:RNA-dependent RNA polymerase n=1 Tax=Ancylostoma ceylanicum TaxID=53326 RepID=A0A016STD8_9BILA|nr:hypothetical protein Y032_0180g820 [Ancylostoma ceylanicum]
MGEVIAAQGRLKLEVPIGNASNTTRTPPYAIKQVELLNESLDKYRISYDEPVQTAVEEPGCEKFLVFNYEVRSLSFFRTLLPTIRCFLNRLRDARMPYHFTPTVIIHSMSCFSSEVISGHPNTPLAAVYFGNIQGGVFINHWEVSYRDKSEQLHDDKRWSKINADFLYDQNEVLSITFENSETGNVWEGENGKSRQPGTAHYQIGIRLNFIRRIIVDNAVTDAYGRDRTRIHFDLNCPVTIRRGFVRNRPDKNPFVEVRKDRWKTIYRGRRENEFAHELAISDSPVFTIEFDDTPSDATIYAILSRLRTRTGVSIEFAAYEDSRLLPLTEQKAALRLGITSFGFDTDPNTLSEIIDYHSEEIEDEEEEEDEQKIVDKSYSTKCCPYATWTGKGSSNVNAATTMEDPTMRAFIKDTVKKEDVEEGDPGDVVRERIFSLQYLIECLISRGAVVKDQLLLDKAVWIDFLLVLNKCYRENREACLYSLERLVTMIDERKRLGSLVMAFILEYQTVRDRGIASALSRQEISEGYTKVRKLVITQTRVIYVVPEMLMANRVIRQYDHDGTRIIRVAFRDDDNQTMRTNKTSKALIVNTLRKFMLEGLIVADRSFGYLGSSNSQMRDSGAYFLEKFSRKALQRYMERYNKMPPIRWQPKIDLARERLGRFTDMESIPKLMARLGQCFTQSKKSSLPIERIQYAVTYDIIGGGNQQGKEYTYSDGVGMMSRAFASGIARDMLLGNCVPSCFQFRFRGMKGVVAINPLLDEISNWAADNGIEAPRRKFGSWKLRMVFRPSQIKFDAVRKKNDSLEVVKYSAPVPVALNKPFICILDQVSEMQSYDCHARVTNRIEELLDMQLRGFARTMLREHDCRNKLKELPRRIDIDRLSVVSGFQLSTEPFFRSLIKATIKYAITKQMRKQQIQIPYDKGRSMLGVVDETGQLQYGQIFVQYTENIALKTPPPNAAKKILTGKVLLTKNPCIVAGDVRVFEAVDIPELRHLCDVVVFPMHGPRPHPDEMAGSDLDGDEYSVIWDSDLLLDRNEEPFDYTADKPQIIPINKETLNEDMVNFYISYITQDSVGTISNSFLFQADLYGLNSEVCLRLAKKISQAVDFTKTGLPPAPLVKDWTEDEETGKEIPPEKSERQPDFHFGNDYEPTYRSARLMGRIYREIKAIEDVLKISEDIDEQDVVECDRYLMVDGWDKYREVAEAQLSKYKGRLRAIMENYGIKSEGEIFSGCICEMRNRISDKDQDDMSFYNTNEVIEKKVTSLFREFREEFFYEFGGWQRCTKLAAKKFAIEENVFHRYVQHPPLEMQQKAVAYYRVCYDTLNFTSLTQKFPMLMVCRAIYTSRAFICGRFSMKTGQRGHQLRRRCDKPHPSSHRRTRVKRHLV